MLSRLSPAERFAKLAQGCSFRVHGLSATLARVRDFQKLAALMQMTGSNPLLLQAFVRRFSGDKILTHMLKTLNINPEHIEQDPEEMAMQGQRNQQLMQLMQMGIGAKGGAVQQAESGGEPALPAEINQASNPLSGMVG